MTTRGEMVSIPKNKKKNKKKLFQIKNPYMR